jgi:hypothetical protein
VKAFTDLRTDTDFLLRSILPEFYQYLAINTSSTFHYKFKSEKKQVQVPTAKMYFNLANTINPMHIQYITTAFLPLIQNCT